MKLSKMILGTLREAAAEAELESHKLMLRGGVVRKTASGVYNFMPMGMKSIYRIYKLIQNQMDLIAAQEIQISTLIPDEIIDGDQSKYNARLDVFKTGNKNERQFYVGGPYEESFLDFVKSEIKSYKQLPINIYSIQKQMVNEQKPKFGIIKSKEFNSFQCYGFYSDLCELKKGYDNLNEAINSIFYKCKLDFYKTNSNKFFIKHSSGEDQVVSCQACGYIEDLEKANCNLEDEEEVMKPLKKIATPDARTIDELADLFNTSRRYFIKTIIYKINDKIVGVMVRGDREVNEGKVKNKIGRVVSFQLADEETVRYATSAEIGFAGPINLKCDMLLVDEEVTRMHNFMVGANETGYHYENVNYQRDFIGNIGNFKKITEHDMCPLCKNALKIENAISIGEILNLGTTYSEPMNAMFLDRDGESKPIYMIKGSINIDRLLALIIEQNHDENGIVWPIHIAPYEVDVICAVFKNEEQMKVAEDLYRKLKLLGIDALLDDRDERAGVKFKDADLVGVPVRITVGKKISEGKIELKLRKDSDIETIDIEDMEKRVLLELNKD